MMFAEGVQTKTEAFYGALDRKFERASTARTLFCGCGHVYASHLPQGAYGLGTMNGTNCIECSRAEPCMGTHYQPKLPV